MMLLLILHSLYWKAHFLYLTFYQSKRDAHQMINSINTRLNTPGNAITSVLIRTETAPVSRKNPFSHSIYLQLIDMGDSIRKTADPYKNYPD